VASNGGALLRYALRCVRGHNAKIILTTLKPRLTPWLQAGIPPKAQGKNTKWLATVANNNRSSGCSGARASGV